MLLDGEIWLSLAQIVWINILLSGDNAVVIALACRSLPRRQQRLGMILGTAPAVVLRIIFALVIVYLMEIAYLKLIGGVLLFWIAVKMQQPEAEAHGGEESSGDNSSLWRAVRTILIADIVMSLDNVIAIAAAANGHVVLLAAGLAISMPLIIFGSAVLLELLRRFPILVTLGGALLGYIAGEVMVGDPAVAPWIAKAAPFLHVAVPIVGAVAAVAVGYGLAHLAADRDRRCKDRDLASQE